LERSRIVSKRHFKTQFELLEPRALLSHLGPHAVPAAAPKGTGASLALVGSIQGTETPVALGWRLKGTGTVQPLGEVTVTGFLGGGPPHGTGGAAGGTGTLSLSNGQGSVTLSMKSHGFFRVPGQMAAEEIRVSVQVRSASGAYSRIRVAGTINLVSPIVRHRVGTYPTLPFSAQFSIKAVK
jgi:hypothetical protein